MKNDFGGDFRSTNLDLLLATLIALGLPLVAARLLAWTGGAAASLALYYGVCCVIIPRWRKGTLDYRLPPRWPWLIFGLCLLVPLALAAANWGNLPQSDASLIGFCRTYAP